MKTLLRTLALLVLLVPALHAQTIPNAGFEDASLSPWTNTGTGTVSVVKSGAVADNGAIPEGTHVAALACGTSANLPSLSTTITGLVAGGHYHVTCRVNAKTTTSQVLAVLSVAGNQIASRNQQSVGGSAQYDSLSGIFTAASDTATLALSAASLSAETLLVDDFKIVRTDVTTNANAGPGSLRQALADAAAAPGPDIIGFDSALAGQTISLASTIAINDAGGVTVDASGVPGIVIDDGTAQTYGLFLVGQNRNVTFRGLTLANGGGTGYTGGGAAVGNAGTLTLERCTLSGNSSPGATINNAGGAISNSGMLTLTNCTLAGNSSGSKGGAIFAQSSSTTTLTHCTVSGNVAAEGGGIYNDGGTLTLTNTIVVGNTDTAAGASTDNISGTFTGSNNLTSGAPKLDPLADNGGPTKTMALQPGNPALDMGVVLNPVLTTDQRGFARNLDGDGNGAKAPDIGAFEAQSVPNGNVTVAVTTTVDEANLNGTLGTGISLREALRDAPAGATIVFDTALLNGQNITLSAALGDIFLDKNVTIDASSLSNGVTITRGTSGSFRLLTVPAGVNVTLRGLTLTGGQGGSQGGAIRNAGTLTLTNCTLSGNSALTGGAIYNQGALTLTDCTLSRNDTAPGGTDGGAIYHASGTLTLTTCTLFFNGSFRDGGAIYLVTGTGTLTGCTLASNYAVNGGAIQSTAVLTLTNCTLSTNIASFNGGANTGIGGAIANAASLTLTGCTFDRNFTNKTAAAANLLISDESASGGAIYNPAALAGQTLTITNCTFTGNSSVNDGTAIATPGAATITHSTFVGNFRGDPLGNGAIAVYASGTLSIGHCIVAGSVSGNRAGLDIYKFGGSSTVTPIGANLIGVNGSVEAEFPEGPRVGTDALPLDPKLAALASNGGPTQTMLPLPGSPAIDAATGSSTPKDQRGFDRAKDGDGNSSVVADLGAVERGTLLLPVVSTAADSGAGSLRQAFADAATATYATITFAPGFTGPIVLSSEFVVPANKAITVDASNVAGGVILAGGGTSRIFTVVAGGELTLKGLTLTGGRDEGSLIPAGDGSLPTYSEAFGGAIFNQGTLTLMRCTLSGNFARGRSVGVTSNGPDKPDAAGGAIFNQGTLALTQCTLSGNAAYTNDAVPGGTLRGGAIANEGNLTLTHCTLSGNSTYGFGSSLGGAIYNQSALSLTHCTVSGNSADHGGGIENKAGGVATLSNTIVAGNSAPSGPDIENISSTINPTGKNLIGDTAGSGLSAGANVIVNPMPKLSALGNYGGPTQTIFPLAGSPAIDAGVNASIPSGVTTDQRGSLLPFGTTVDIGAVEVGRIVTNTNDSGAGSLREAVNSTVAGGMIITFDSALNGQTISLTSGAILIDKDLEINAEGLASGVTVNGASQNFRLCYVSGIRTVALHNLKLNNGGGTNFNSFGGGILNEGYLTLTRCTLSGNQVKTGNSGGAISGSLGSTLSLTECTLSGNTADGGGAIVTVTPARLNRCTLNANIARAGNGGAISVNTSTLSLTQCTVANNTATGGNGGGIYGQSSTLTMIHCTIAGNTTSGSGGGVFADGQNTGGFAIANTIIAGNTMGVSGFGPDFYESGNPAPNVRFTGRVFIGVLGGNAFSADDRVRRGNAMLNSLGNYGGPTQTMVPLANSPVRDLADGTANQPTPGSPIAVNFATDQRGFPRPVPVGGASDLGATEAGSISLTNLVLSAGALSPGFAPATTTYTASVPAATASVAITPTTAAGTIKVNNVAVTSGAASGSIALTPAQPVAITVVVTGLDGATRTYTVTVTRAGSANADLTGLTLSTGTLTPNFASGTTSYAASVPNATASLNVTATRADANATLQVRVNGGNFSTLTSGTASSLLGLNVGDNPIEVKVTPQSGTPVTYTVTVHRNARPALTLPPSPIVVTSQTSAVVNFTVTASDAEDGPLTAMVSQPSGSTFSIGDTTVNVSATDSAGDTAIGSFVVRVQGPAVGSTLSFASGAAAPGAGGPSGLPTGAVIVSFDGLETTDSGGLAYRATWKVVGPPKQQGTGLFLDNMCLAVFGGDASGLLPAIAFAKGAAFAEGAALTSAAGVRFKSFTAPVADAGRMVSIAGFTGTPTAPASAVVTFATGDTALSAVARVGEVAPLGDGSQPDGGAVFQKFKAVTTHAGSIAIFARLASGSKVGFPVGTRAEQVTTASDLALFLKDGTGPLKLALREGQTINLPGSGPRTIKTLVSFAAGNGSPGQGRGWLALRETYGGDPGTPCVLALALFTDKSQAILSARGEGSFATYTATGYSGYYNRPFVTFGLPTTNDNLEVAFQSTLGAFPGSRDAGQRVMIYRTEGSSGVAYLGLNDAAPHPLLSTMKDPVLAEDGGVAYYGTLIDRAHTPLLRWKPPGLDETTIAQAREHAAEVPGAKWKTFPSLAIMNGRGPLFIATLALKKSVVTAANATGVWAVDSTGALRLLFRAGVTQVDVNGTLKTVKSFSLLKAQVGSPGVTHSFNDAGQVTWIATFTDKTTAIVTTQVP